MAPADVQAAFNPFDPAFVADPYPTYAALRASERTPRAFGAIVLSRYRDVAAALCNPDLGVSLIPDMVAERAAKFGLEGTEQLQRFIRGSIVFTDEPGHSRLKRLIGAAYGGRTIEALKSAIRGRAERLLAEAEKRPAADMIAAFAAKLPTQVLCDALDLDDEHHAFVSSHVHAVRELLDPGLLTPRKLTLAKVALGELVDFFVGRSRSPSDGDAANLLHTFRNVRVGGDALSEEEVGFAATMSFVAGTETTQSLLANLLVVLSDVPGLHRRLRREPALAAAAVEETLRIEAPLQFAKRVAYADTAVNEIRIPVRSQVLICIGAANRDPDAFADPDRFDLCRAGVRGFALGHGPHSCLGSRMARLQAEIALQVLVDRCDAFARVSDRVDWRSGSVILRGPRVLPMRLTSRAA